jgi:hypothetical protein
VSLELALMGSSILCSLLNMWSRCFAGRCQTALLAAATNASPTGLPKSLPKRASSRRPENGQRLAAKADHPGAIRKAFASWLGFISSR